MKKTKLKTVETRVRDILTKNKTSRESDNVLLDKFYKNYYGKKWDTMTAHEFLMDYNAPSIGSVNRTRRKLQALDVTLKGSKTTQAYRRDMQKKYASYALEK